MYIVKITPEPNALKQFLLSSTKFRYLFFNHTRTCKLIFSCPQVKGFMFLSEMQIHVLPYCIGLPSRIRVSALVFVSDNISIPVFSHCLEPSRLAARGIFAWHATHLVLFPVSTLRVICGRDSVFPWVYKVQAGVTYGWKANSVGQHLGRSWLIGPLEPFQRWQTVDWIFHSNMSITSLSGIFS